MAIRLGHSEKTKIYLTRNGVRKAADKIEKHKYTKITWVFSSILDKYKKKVLAVDWKEGILAPG